MSPGFAEQPVSELTVTKRRPEAGSPLSALLEVVESELIGSALIQRQELLLLELLSSALRQGGSGALELGRAVGLRRRVAQR